MQVIKRDGRIVDFDRQKIAAAIGKANAEVKPRERASKEDIKGIIEYVEGLDKKRILVEDIQDISINFKFSECFDRLFNWLLR